MLKLEGVAAFVAVVESGSITEAARHLGTPKSVVSDRLAELERTLGARLLQRTTRKVSVTADGTAFLPRGRRMLQDAADALDEFAARRGTLAGPLRISAPVSFGTLHLGRALFPLLSANPGLDLTLDLEDRFVDVAADGYDAVIRHGAMRDTHLVARRLASSRRVLVAAPGYLDANRRTALTVRPRTSSRDSLPASRSRLAVCGRAGSRRWCGRGTCCASTMDC